MSEGSVERDQERVAAELWSDYGIDYERSIKGGIAIKAAGDVETIASDAQVLTEATPPSWD